MEMPELLDQIKLAMKAHDKVRLGILRQVNQAAKQIEVDERRDVTEADLTAIIKKLRKVTGEEIDGLRKAGSDAHADRISELSSQDQVLSSMLPAQLDGAMLTAEIDRIIRDGELSSKRDMGKIMGELTKLTNGNFDKPAAAAYAGTRLS